ncbi:hypothetical protein [Vibrio tubiashii]|uniref:hypothetical protein n=1 Tax=Vibrio tubiashii TaxID=29498 RepID=UPI00349EC488
MKKFILFFLLVISGSANASLQDCNNLYVGRIVIEKGVGLSRVVYLDHHGNSSGSYWSSFTGWTPDQRSEALSVLLTAKAAQHRVNVETENADGCGLSQGFTVTKTIYLANNP